MFWVCSRIFSSSALISTTIRARRTSVHLEPMVLVSRFISWSRKSSFLPMAPPEVSSAGYEGVLAFRAYVQF